ncbi:threonine/serine exporter family protein [Oceanobacillus bengalensis]|uniref:Threonine/serine exporter n=1 Tax=Oceanobacillus bengalensis TaxID=1435466 RepID=A0A494YRF5_9BACI|nr:threonine/serine exporter family protein [Oceanobacillus bengalensis]RKQ11952.1 threonine/serine exporter [Oceanobacillus bengalensis]
MIAQLITSFIASAGFAILFNAPKNTLIQCGFVGMSGWILYYVLVAGGMDAIPATVLSAMLVAVVSHIFAKTFKTPIIIFNVAGIIPLVPGGVSYNAMRNFVENNYDIALQLSAQVMLLAGAIAIGLMFSEVINQITKKVFVKR